MNGASQLGTKHPETTL